MTKQQLEIEGLLHIGGEGFVRWLRQRTEPISILVLPQFSDLDRYRNVITKPASAIGLQVETELV